MDSDWTDRPYPSRPHPRPLVFVSFTGAQLRYTKSNYFRAAAPRRAVEGWNGIRHEFITITLQASGQKDYVYGIGSAQVRMGTLCSWLKRLDEHVTELFELLRTPDFLRE